MLTIVTRADVDCGDACDAPRDWNAKHGCTVGGCGGGGVHPVTHNNFVT